MAQHTPGPWDTETWGDGKVSIGPSSGDVVAWMSDIPGDEAKANAALIAAAPLLLEALRWLLRALDAEVAQAWNDGGWDRERRAARAALALAEGKEK